MVTRRGFLAVVPAAAVCAHARARAHPAPVRHQLDPEERLEPSQPGDIEQVVTETFKAIARAYERNSDDECRAVLSTLCPDYHCHRCPLRWALRSRVPALPVELDSFANPVVLFDTPTDLDVRVVETMGHSAFLAITWWHVRARERLALHWQWPVRELVFDLLAAPPLCPRKLAAGQLTPDEWTMLCRRGGALVDSRERLVFVRADADFRAGYRHLGHGWRFLRAAAIKAHKFVAIVTGDPQKLAPGIKLAVFQLAPERPVRLVSPWQLRLALRGGYAAWS